MASEKIGFLIAWILRVLTGVPKKGTFYQAAAISVESVDIEGASPIVKSSDLAVILLHSREFP